MTNIGTDIFVVQELADHASVQTTLNAYVQVQDDRLREAVDLLQQHRIDSVGRSQSTHATLGTRTLAGVNTNDCANPQVLTVGVLGCHEDRDCFQCDDIIADPSHIERIKSEIATCIRTLHHLDVTDQRSRQPARVEVLEWKRDGWRAQLRRITDHLDALPETKRLQVLAAAKSINDFRGRIHNNAGITLGTNPP